LSLGVSRPEHLRWASLGFDRSAPQLLHTRALLRLQSRERSSRKNSVLAQGPLEQAWLLTPERPISPELPYELSLFPNRRIRMVFSLSEKVI
jgi:hypothetical protein